MRRRLGPQKGLQQREFWPGRGLPKRLKPLLAIALVTWFAVVLQLFLNVRQAIENGDNTLDGIVTYFGYFTVLSNILVALVATLRIQRGNWNRNALFNHPMALGCATTAILMVGIAYHLLLRHIRDPQGWGWLANCLLHYVVPASALAYWYAWPPGRLPRWAPLAWCIYPLSYLVYVLARGEMLGDYPYYFIDASELGYGPALLNGLGLTAGFAVLGTLLWGLARLRARRTRWADR